MVTGDTAAGGGGGHRPGRPPRHAAAGRAAHPPRCRAHGRAAPAERVRLAVRGHRRLGRAGQGPHVRGRAVARTADPALAAGQRRTARPQPRRRVRSGAAGAAGARRPPRGGTRASSTCSSSRSRSRASSASTAAPELMRKAVELGADVVGGIPHYELTREDGVESVKFAIALADEHGLRVDIHCDETDDDHSRFVEVMAAETIRRGHVRPGHGESHDGDALVQQRVRVPAHQQHRAGRPAHGHEPAGQRRAAGPLRHRPDPPRPHAGQAAAGGRRQRLRSVTTR